MEGMNYMYAEEDDDEGVEYDNRLPVSQQSGQSYQGLLKINQIYATQLSKITQSANAKNKKKISLPNNDLKVLNSLLKENFIYLTILLKYKNSRIEFDNLYFTSIQILNLLSQFPQVKLNIYQKLQKLKFMELKFQNLRISGREIDYSEADALLEDMEKIQYDPSLSEFITDLELSTLKLNRALIKFCICDFTLAKEYALNALDILDEFNPLRSQKNSKIKKRNDEEEKYIKKLTQAHEFLAELYDLERDYQNALSSYEKCYYLYIGRYGINHPLITPIKKRKNYMKKN
jgi:hypothetical protein